MNSELDERLDVAGEIMRRLIEQNLALTSRIIALENVVACSVAQQFCKDRPDLDGMARFSAEVSGTAAQLADFIYTELPSDDYQATAVPHFMKRVVSMAQDICTSRQVTQSRSKRPSLRLVENGKGA